MEPLQMYLSYAYERELFLGRCYASFAQLYSEHSAFWNELAEEEVQHGTLILEYVKTLNNTAAIPFVAEIDVIADLFDFVEEVKVFYQLMSTDAVALTLEDTVKLTSHFEMITDTQTALEQNLAQIEGVGTLLIRIGESSTHHYKRVKKWAQTLGISVGDTPPLAYYIDKVRPKTKFKSDTLVLPKPEVTAAPFVSNFLNEKELPETSSITQSTLPKKSEVPIVKGSTALQAGELSQETLIDSDNLYTSDSIESTGEDKKSGQTMDTYYSALAKENALLKDEIKVLKQAIAILTKN